MTMNSILYIYSVQW